MSIQLPHDLQSRAQAKYDQAASSSALRFSPTQLETIHCAAGPFQVRYLPSLAHKPTPSEPKDASSKQPSKPAFNPFLNPSADLLIAPLPTDSPTHNLVLNKFPIIPYHLILSSASFIGQTTLLSAQDLALTHALVHSWPDLFAFYNSGPESGASQPHRHLQLIPLEAGWRTLVDRALDGAETGVAVHVEPLTESATGEELRGAYLRLLRRAFGVDLDESAMAEWVRGVSYNLALSQRGMGVVRRTRAGWRVGEGEVQVNGTVLAGTVLVKGKAEWEILQREEGALDAVLRGISGDGGEKL